jgi:penicillin-binding protein 1C
MTARPITLRRVLGVARWAALLGLLAWIAGSLAWSALRARVGHPHGQFEDAWHRGHRVLDRHGALLRELPSDTGRRGRPLPLDEIGDRLVVTTLVSEDREFYDHDGIDHAALARAMKQNVAHARLVSGASTVTQQLVKMLDTEGEPGARTLAGKLIEMARAQNLEEDADKSEILAQYLNRLPYGHGLVGPEAAAQGYFGVSAKDLSWAQASFLAVLPRAPSFLDPYRHPERVRLRQAALIEALHETGYLTELERDRALAESLEARPLCHPFHAPHLIETLRVDGELAGSDITQTTLDLELQADVEGMVSTHLAALARQDEPGGADDAAVLVVDNASGEVLAYVGSADFHDPEIAGQVDMVRALRQPGSSLKPFVYALAFANGHTGPQMLPDVPTRFVEGGGEYDPRNFHRGFEGPISAREALASSLNVPAVRLTAELGVDALLELLHRLGLESLNRDPEHYGVALALGSGEVRLWDLAGAYVTLARGGDRVELRATVADRAAIGEARTGTDVIASEVAAAVTEALSDPLARARLLAGRSPFDLGFPVAVKTGTSSGYRDTWAVGYTSERTVAVWLGNADGAPTNELTGASGAGPLFGDVMRRAMREVSTRAPLWDADLLTTVEVCPLSGLPAGPACPDRVRHRFARGHVPDEPCRVHRHARHAHDGLVCDEDGPLTVAVFPDEYAAWLEAQPVGAPGRSPHGIEWHPAVALRGCADEEAHVPAMLRLEQPLTGTAFLAEADGTALVQVQARLEGANSGLRGRLEAIEVLVDGQVVDQAGAPFAQMVRVPRGDHELSVRPVDARLPVRTVASRISVR